MVWPTIPTPGPEDVFTNRYALVMVPRASVNPSSPANCLSGRIAIKFPPAFTQLVRSVTCPEVKGVSPRMTTSYCPSVAGEMEDTSAKANSFKPSVNKISE